MNSQYYDLVTKTLAIYTSEHLTLLFSRDSQLTKLKNDVIFELSKAVTILLTYFIAAKNTVFLSKH